MRCVFKSKSGETCNQWIFFIFSYVSTYGGGSVCWGAVKFVYTERESFKQKWNAKHIVSTERWAYVRRFSDFICAQTPEEICSRFRRHSDNKCDSYVSLCVSRINQRTHTHSHPKQFTFKICYCVILFGNRYSNSEKCWKLQEFYRISLLRTLCVSFIVNTTYIRSACLRMPAT